MHENLNAAHSCQPHSLYRFILIRYISVKFLKSRNMEGSPWMSSEFYPCAEISVTDFLKLLSRTASRVIRTSWGRTTVPPMQEPYYLGSGDQFTKREQIVRDLGLSLAAAHQMKIPNIIGSAGTAGGERPENCPRGVCGDGSHCERSIYGERGVVPCAKRVSPLRVQGKKSHHRKPGVSVFTL